MSWAKAPDFADRPDVRERVRADSAADREAQLRSGLRPVDCAHCGTRVLAKKNSPDHTSVQWTRDAVRTCPELGPHARDGSTAHVDGCPDLAATIDQAVRTPGSGD